jgi:putative oxidoreductase
MNGTARLPAPLAHSGATSETENGAAPHPVLHLLGRVLIAAVFVISAVAKAATFDPEASGLLLAVFWASVALELVAGLLLAAGLWSRKAALVLLVWIGIGIVFFHGDLSVDANRVFTLANVAIAGGLFVLVAQGGGLFSLDHWREVRRLARQQQGV